MAALPGVASEAHLWNLLGPLPHTHVGETWIYLSLAVWDREHQGVVGAVPAGMDPGLRSCRG